MPIHIKATFNSSLFKTSPIPVLYFRPSVEPISASQNFNSSPASDETVVSSTDLTDDPTSTSTPVPSQSPLEVETFPSISAGHTVFVTVTNTASSITRAPPSTEAEVDDSNDSDSNPAGAIAGGLVGGLFVLAAILLILVLIRRKKRTKEHRESTLPPPYNGGDMSEQLASRLHSLSNTKLDWPLNGITGGTTTSESETKCSAGVDDRDEREAVAPTPDPVPHLDSMMVVPATEICGDPLGNIPELSAERNSNPFINAHLPTESGSSYLSMQPRHSKTKGKGRDTDEEAQDHVMSWASYNHWNSRGNRNAASRLSSPHKVPDISVSVWENMSPGRRPEEK